MLLWSDFLPVVRRGAHVDVWANSITSGAPVDRWTELGANASTFPEVHPFRERVNLARRVNEAAWDTSLQPVSRLSMQRLAMHEPRLPRRITSAIGRIPGHLGLAESLEKKLESVLIRQTRSLEASERLDRSQYDLILTTSPFWFHEPAVSIEARKRRIPVAALIPSWDNITTKNRMVLSYDAYLVWSETSREELARFYPNSRDKAVEIIGTPQYDAFFHPELRMGRTEFLAGYGLDPDLKTVLYALGSPNFIAGEPEGALRLAEDIDQGRLSGCQMILRPHPVHDDGAMRAVFARFAPRVVVQSPSQGGDSPAERGQSPNHIRDWLNTFWHADVVVSLASTVSLDAAFADTPAINLAYDPSPEAPQQRLVHEINEYWSHLEPIRQSGGAWTVRNHEELLEAIARYLESPRLHEHRRRDLLRQACGFVDGRSGERMARAVLRILDALPDRE